MAEFLCGRIIFAGRDRKSLKLDALANCAEICCEFFSLFRPSTAEINLGASRDATERLFQSVLSLLHNHSELDDW